MRTRLWILILTAVVIAGAMVVWEFCYGMTEDLSLTAGTLRLEFMKLLWQFLLIAVLGGALGLFFKEQEKVKERRAAQREVKLRTRDQLIEAYHQAKAVRRLLRGLAIYSLDGQEVVRRSEYNALMQRIIDVQLRFEFYAETIGDNFTSGGSLSPMLDKAEKYLNEIAKEFEKAWEQFGSQDSVPLSTFPKLREFIQDFVEGSNFDLELKTPVHDVLAAIETEVSKP